MQTTLCIGLTVNFTRAFMLKVTAKLVCVCRVQKLQQLITIQRCVRNTTLDGVNFFCTAKNLPDAAYQGCCISRKCNKDRIKGFSTLSSVCLKQSHLTQCSVISKVQENSSFHLGQVEVHNWSQTSPVILLAHLPKNLFTQKLVKALCIYQLLFDIQLSAS